MRPSLESLIAMTPIFRILVGDEVPEGLEYLPVNEECNWDFAPQSEYLEALTEFQQRLYGQLRSQNWSDEQCYFYFSNLDVTQGFRREWLRHKGWTEGRIQEWNRECQRTNIAPAVMEGTNPTQSEQALIMKVMKEGNRRRDLSNDMDKESN